MTNVKKAERLYLVYSWKSGDARVVKTKPGRLQLGQVAFELNLALEIPEPDIPKLALKYSVSAAEVELVAGEAIEAHLLGPDGQPLEVAS